MQYVAMAMDVSILQPTSSHILSYLMHGMNDSGTMPEWRLSTGKTWAAIWSSYNVITEASCIGLLSNDTAMHQLKVPHHLQAVKPFTSSGHRSTEVTRDRSTLIGTAWEHGKSLTL
jgi:hypothetical protein